MRFEQKISARKLFYEMREDVDRSTVQRDLGGPLGPGHPRPAGQHPPQHPLQVGGGQTRAIESKAG